MTLASVTSALATGNASLGSLGGGVEVDFDATVIVQVVLFVVLMLILKPLLFEPMLKLFEERERRIDGAKLHARQLDQDSADALSKYESEMQKARASANAERDRLRAEGIKMENEILGKVRQSTAKTLEEGRKRVQEELQSARAQLTTDSSALAVDLASRVLGREVR